MSFPVIPVILQSGMIICPNLGLSGKNVLQGTPNKGWLVWGIRSEMVGQKFEVFFFTQIMSHFQDKDRNILLLFYNIRLLLLIGV